MSDQSFNTWNSKIEAFVQAGVAQLDLRDTSLIDSVKQMCHRLWHKFKF